MKKGDVSLQSLVKLIPHLLLTIGLIAVLVSLYSVFTSKEKSPEEQDFNRIVEELKSMLERQQEVDCIRVPVQSSSTLAVSVNPKNSIAAPAGCAGDACLCLNPPKGKMDCRRFTKIDECPASKNNCFKFSSNLAMNEGDTVVTILKDSTGIELKANEPCDVQP